MYGMCDGQAVKWYVYNNEWRNNDIDIKKWLKHFACSTQASWSCPGLDYIIKSRGGCTCLILIR